MQAPRANPAADTRAADVHETRIAELAQRLKADNARIADRVVMLRDGKVLAAGHAGDTINSENLSALYGRPIDVAEVISADGVRRRTCVARELAPMH